MDRNRIFVLAYISFIIVSTVVRGFWIFPMWKNLVAAVTFASFFLVLSDWFASSSKSILELSEKGETQVTHQIEHVNNTIFYIKVMIHNKLYPEKKSDLIDIIKRLEKISKETEKRKDIFERNKKTRRSFNIVAFIMTFVAFFMFFCILFFEPISDFFIKGQDVYTMIAFSSVLLLPFF